MKYAEWVQYKDKQFLVMRARDVDEEGFREMMMEMRDELVKKPEARTLVDLTGTRMTPGMNGIAKAVNQEIMANLEAKGLPMGPSALVGIRPIIRAVVQLISRNEKTYYASSIEDGLEWLYRQG